MTVQIRCACCGSSVSFDVPKSATYCEEEYQCPACWRMMTVSFAVHHEAPSTWWLEISHHDETLAPRTYTTGGR